MSAVLYCKTLVVVFIAFIFKRYIKRNEQCDYYR